MKAKIFSTREYEREYLVRKNMGRHEFHFETKSLTEDTADLAKGFEAVSVFTNDDLSEKVLKKLSDSGVRYIAIRATGYDHVDLRYAESVGIKVANVPSYSPYSVAEHAVCLMLVLSRKIITADHQVGGYDFTLDNLIGFDLHSKTVGIIGTGRLGSTVAGILKGFGCNLLAYDISPDPVCREQYHVQYCTLEELFKKSDIITLHLPLNESSKYIINKDSITLMKNGVMIINTGRGGLINTEDAIAGIKSGKIGYMGIDVYEREKGIFFFDHSGEKLTDDTLLKLMSLKNVIITPHQGFLTREALSDIAGTTIDNLNCWEDHINCPNELTREMTKII